MSELLIILFLILASLFSVSQIYFIYREQDQFADGIAIFSTHIMFITLSIFDSIFYNITSNLLFIFFTSSLIFSIFYFLTNKTIFAYLTVTMLPVYVLIYVIGSLKQLIRGI